MFKRKAKAAEPQPGDIAGWRIVAELDNGRTFELSARVYASDNDGDEMLRVCDAVVDGLERAGFPATATVTREQREVRP